MAPSGDAGHLELFEARLAEFRQAGMEIYPSNLEEQLRERDIRQKIREIEEAAHEFAHSAGADPNRPGHVLDPPQLPANLFDLPVAGLGSIFYYRRGEVNYDVKAAGELRRELGDLIPEPDPHSRPSRTVRIPEGRFANFRRSPEDDLRALKELRDHLAAQPENRNVGHDLVAPNHVFTAGPVDCGGPGSEPELPTVSSISAPQGNAGAGIRIAVLDSGILPRQLLPSWLNRDLIFRDEDVEDDFFDQEGDERITRFPRVHGTFVAGIIRQQAPGATLLIKRVLDPVGVVREDVLAAKLLEVLRDKPDIINLSLGCKSFTGSLPPVLNDALTELKSAAGPIVVVAAAGNEGRRIDFWPAVDPDVLGVGSVDASGRWAHCNFGPPVDIWARGADVHSVFAQGTYRREATKNEVVFDKPIARWSGTSFATPLVTGMIAAAMRENGTRRSAIEARDAVLHAGRDSTGLLPDGSGGQQVPLVLKDVTLPG